MIPLYRLFFVSILVVFVSCASYEKQYNSLLMHMEEQSKDSLLHKVFLIGDAGNSKLGEMSIGLKALQGKLDKAKNNSSVLFLGDNIYPAGLPDKGQEGRKVAKHRLQVQLDVVKSFEGDAYFLPGNHDWYADGLEGLKRQEKYIEKTLGKGHYMPEDGCPLDKVTIGKDIVIIFVDSQWYLTNWDKHPTINDECEIKTREKFLDEFSSLVKKARGKTTLIAIHHPMYSNGPHGGQYTVKQQMDPLPILGTAKNILRNTTGVSNADIQNKRYLELQKRLTTLAKENKKVVFVSGHEHSLQYLIENNTKQIVSGAGSKISGSRNVGGGVFSYSKQGFGVIEVYKNGASILRFYAGEDAEEVFAQELFPPMKQKKINYPETFPDAYKSSIYTPDETEKSTFYTWMLGKRYRSAYSQKILAPTVALDTLFGGLIPVRAGGGNQSMSLRLKDKQGREYVMRALRKNAVQYLQSFLYKDKYVKNDFVDTYAEDFLLDGFTGSYPYAPFVVGDLASAIGVMHTNPVLYYVPKQNTLGVFNEDYGDALYMIEERASSNHGDKKSFGYSDTLISTDDLLKKLRKDEDNLVDESSYIRARLFDMVIGDWDRHDDQWRWAVFNEGKDEVYRPMPRDRDQAFSKMADGTLLSIVTTLIRSTRLLNSYDETLKDVKWFNMEPYPLDVALIENANSKVWEEEALFIKEHLTDEVIEKAFLNVPSNLQNETIETIKYLLKQRRDNVLDIAKRYRKIVQKYVLLKGTDKEDFFEISRLSKGQTNVKMYRYKDGEKGEKYLDRTFDRKETRELWIYGLDAKDIYEVKGSGDNRIKIRMIGGQNNDTYQAEDTRKLIVHDFKSKKNTIVTEGIRSKLSDRYEANIYTYDKVKNNSNQIVPILGANPDDGFKIGLRDTYTVYNYERNPFTSKHDFAAAFFIATNGFELDYKGEFAHVFGEYNIGVDARITSPNFNQNFFGFGNTTENLNREEPYEFSKNYNRVKIRTINVSPSLIWKGQLGGEAFLKTGYSYYKVEDSLNRFISSTVTTDLEEAFLDYSIGYRFENVDDTAFPTLGMRTKISVGGQYNLDTEKSLFFVHPSLTIIYKVLHSKKLALACKLESYHHLNSNYSFYQAANIGADRGLRAYRNQRFSGDHAFVHSTDLRWNMYHNATSIFPIQLGVYAGLDYGKVWLKGESSDKWHSDYGGGFFMTMAELITVNLSLFQGEDGARGAFALGFSF